MTQSIEAPHFTFYFKCSCSGPDRGFTEHSGETEERTEEKERQGELFTGRSGWLQNGTVYVLPGCVMCVGWRVKTAASCKK